MTIDKKLLQLNQEILSETSERLGVLLSLCESPIEKIFLLSLYRYYYNLGLNYVDLKFITRAATDKEENSEKKPPGYYYEKLTEWPVVINGFSIRFYGPMASVPIKQILESPLSFKDFFDSKRRADQYKLTIYPQYAITLEFKDLRMDFAIIVENIDQNKKEIFCIECDGHEWHKTKTQRGYDNERMEILLRNGIKTIRYTGTQIMNFDMARIIEFENTILKNITGNDTFLYLLKNR